jgi:hypothetical protein
MAVNANSVISTTIQSFDDPLYVSITDKEDQVYTSGTNGQLAEFQPQFQLLSDAIIAWMNEDRSTSLSDFIQFLYSYKVFADMYGTDSSLLASSHGDTVIGMGGFRTRIKSDIITYYDDYPQLTFSGSTIERTNGSWIDDGFLDADIITVAGSASNDGPLTIATAGVTATILTLTLPVTAEGPSSNIGITSTGKAMGSANMSTDINLIKAAFAGQETTDINNLQAGYTTTVGGKGFDLLFSSKPPLATLSKDDMATYIFTTLNYRTVFDNLNTGTLKAPPIFVDAKINYDFTI